MPKITALYMKKLFLFLLILTFALAGTGFFAYQKIQKVGQIPITLKQEILLKIERGTTSYKLAQLLEQQNILSDSKLLPYFLKLNPELNKIKAGTYALTGVKTVTDLLKLLNSGKEAQFTLQFIEGETFAQWRKKWEAAPHLAQTLQGKTEWEILKLLEVGNFPKPIPTDKGLFEWKSLEGWLAPETYHYTANSTDLALLKRAYERMYKALLQAWEQRDKDLPLKTPYELLILASIVEKETALDSERGKVASVFINRLKRNMRLQTDPTVIYGMGENYKGNIRKKDLETPTPYNTYTNDGLPPTPIAMPSEQSLMAVAQPEKTNFLYFVADGKGGHKFSRSLAEHNQAVQEYLRWYRQQYGRK